MQIAGIIIEYDPMHRGHLYLLDRVREALGKDAAIVGVMSGNFVQRGDLAVTGKHVRAAAAVRGGMDLVLELPLPWAVAPAERFADGGVQLLMKTGLVTDLAFGSESGDAVPLMETAACLCSPAYEAGLRRLLGEGMTFAACRQAAVRALLGPEKAGLLSSPNNILGIEYCKALLRRGSAIRPMTVKRTGSGHGDAAEGAPSGPASATQLRAALKRPEDKAWALSEMAPAMAELYLAEELAGRAPVLLESCGRAILSRLRSMTPEDFAALDQSREGLHHRLYQASRAARSLDELCALAKTKRYPYSRLRRMALWAYLGLTPGDFPEEVPYLRVLAANAVGCRLLARMRKTAAVPVLTKPADVRRLSPEAQALFALEVRATGLYTLAYPDLSAAAGGAEWRQGPVILP